MFTDTYRGLMDSVKPKLQCSSALEHLEIRRTVECKNPLHLLDVRQLLERHKSSLKSVRLKNMFLIDRNADYARPIRTILDFTTTEMNLDDAELTVRRLRSTSTVVYPNSFTKSFENLALELGVELDDDGWWDFAKCLNLQRRRNVLD
jgi:hypothetical protein